jgi:acyl-coenzyme A thioesterase PaaI-like protein
VADGEPYGGSEPDGPREHLAASLRRLLDAAVVTTTDDETIETLTTAIDTLAAQLEGPDGELLGASMPWPDSFEEMARGTRAYNPVTGAANPLAPPLRTYKLDDGTIVSEVVMRPIHEGPPGQVHGGWIAAVLDQLLGMANTVSTTGGMTAELTIRYRRATPLGVPLTVRARMDSSDGRRMYASGEIEADGVVTVEAKGLFIKPSESTISRLRTEAG